MIDKQQLETLLRANGITPFSKNEEIRSMLLSARWSKNEVDTALMILRENTVNKETTVNTVHKVFRSDERLSPSEIKSLLGIDVAISDSSKESYTEQRIAVERRSAHIAIALSILIAVASVVYVMHREQAGFFYTPLVVDEDYL